MTKWLPLLAFLLAATTAAQPAHLLVESGEGRVIVDGTPAGAPGEWLLVEPGLLEVALVDDLLAWNPRRSSESVEVSAGDSLVVRLELPRRLRVETLPIRARIVREHSDGRRDTLGTAPLTVDVPTDEEIILIADLEGYQRARQRVSVEAPLATLILMPEPGASPESALLPTERSTARRTLVDLGIGAAALAAGAVAVHFKFRADSVDDRYRSETSPERGDEALLDEAL
ncbi:MAG: hypothetical protein AAGK21_13235, partial [Bacteroidota bacterium]